MPKIEEIDSSDITPGFQSPEMIAAVILLHCCVMVQLQDRLGSLQGAPSGYISSLPKEIQGRIKALANIHDKSGELEAKFHDEVLVLKKKYRALNEPLYLKRDSIISGEYEPTAEECEREASDDEEEEEENKEPSTETVDATKQPIKGIPEFWATVLRNHPQIGDIITEKDDPILAYLTNITYSYLEEVGDHGFKLTFTFSENPYFKNTQLTKTYHLLNSTEGVFGDIMFESAEGCTIEWNEGKDCTTTVETKKQRHKGTNKTRVVKKTVKCESFFNFFAPPKIDEETQDEEEMDQIEEMIEADYEIGEIIKEKLCVNAVDWFTGKALQYDDGDSDDYDDEEESDDDEEDDAEGEPAAKPECKQQ